MRSVRAAIAVAALVVAGVVFAAAPAYAHNSFTGSTPKNGAVLDTAPAEVQLKFLAKLDPRTTKITLSDPAGTPALAGAARFTGSTVLVPLKPSVAGVYIASYEVASSDGHPIKGTVSFTLTAKAVPEAEPSPPPPPAPSPTAAGLVTVAGPQATTLPIRNRAAELWWLWLLAAAVVASAAVPIVLARRRRVRS